jgi:hypothetical protein
MIWRSTKPSPDCFPCYRRGYDAAAWTPDFFNLVNHGDEGSMFIRYYPDFEIEGPRNLVDFLEYDIFKSGVKIKDKCLGALRVRIFIGGPNNRTPARCQGIPKPPSRSQTVLKIQAPYPVMGPPRYLQVGLHMPFGNQLSDTCAKQGHCSRRGVSTAASGGIQGGF